MCVGISPPLSSLFARSFSGQAAALLPIGKVEGEELKFFRAQKGLGSLNFRVRVRASEIYVVSFPDGFANVALLCLFVPINNMS